MSSDGPSCLAGALLTGVQSPELLYSVLKSNQLAMLGRNACGHRVEVINPLLDGHLRPTLTLSLNKTGSEPVVPIRSSRRDPSCEPASSGAKCISPAGRNNSPVF